MSFSIPEESEEEEKTQSTTSHAAIDVKTVSKLNHQTVSLISSERDKLRLAGVNILFFSILIGLLYL